MTRADGTVETTEAGFLGVHQRACRPPTSRSPLTAVPGILWAGVSGTAQALVHVPAADGRGLGCGLRRRRALDRQPDVGRRRGPGRRGGRGRASYDALIGERPADKFFFLVGLLAALNIMLFVFNLIPLLPLDGGHVAGALWEGTKRQWARLRGRPDPGYVDVAKALPVAYSVSVVLLGMSAAAHLRRHRQADQARRLTRPRLRRREGRRGDARSSARRAH